jgi:hypothetical protein
MLLVIFFIGSTAFSIPEPRESFYIRNHSSKMIIITTELSDTAKRDYRFEGKGHFIQNINGLDIAIFIPAFVNKVSREGLLPGKNSSIYRLSPLILVEKIPFMDKVRSIYKSFQIITGDGKLVVTLENLGEYVYKRPETHKDLPAYVVDVYDSMEPVVSEN